MKKAIFLLTLFTATAKHVRTQESRTSAVARSISDGVTLTGWLLMLPFTGANIIR